MGELALRPAFLRPILTATKCAKAPRGTEWGHCLRLRGLHYSFGHTCCSSCSGNLLFFQGAQYVSHPVNRLRRAGRVG